MKQKASKPRKELTPTTVFLPYECVCGKDRNCSVEKEKIKKGDVLTTVCGTCKATAFVKIDEMFSVTQEIGYTVGIEEAN